VFGPHPSFFSIFFEKRWFGSRENTERKDKVGNTFIPPAVRTLLFLQKMDLVHRK
jgi:hypothetical protein